MSIAVTDKLSREKVQQLLAAMGSVSQSDTSCNTDAADYDLRQSRYFNLSQFAKLEEFAGKVAREYVEEFSRLYHGDVKVSVVSTEQCFRDQLKVDNEQNNYCIMFGVDPQKPFGLMRIPDSSAAIWTGQVLGGAELTEDSGKRLSKLEESLLLDIVSGLIKAFSRAYGSNLQLDRRVIHDSSSVALQGSEELFMITFEARKADSEKDATRAFFLMCCDKLQSVAGKIASEEGKTAAADNARIMREHVHGMPVSLTVQLAKTSLLFKDVMGLQVNDIMLLDKKVSDPIEILVEDKTLFHGRPAQSGGKHAIVIV
jgi:flagellar motor switch protein FliM